MLTSAARFLAITLLLFISLPALADAPKKLYSTPDLTDKRYYMCRHDSDCTTAQLPCGRIVVTNKYLHDDVQGWFDFIGPKYKCETPVRKQQAKNIACTDYKCTADISLVPNIMPDTPEAKNTAYCKTVDDCAVVEGTCHAKMLVNKIYKDKLQADYDHIRDINKEMCLYPDNRTVVNLRCEENTCKSDLEIPDETYWDGPMKIKERKPK